MARNARQLKILELISKKDIETQDDLAIELLRENFHVTQATISRDIKELGLIKISTHDGRQKYSKEVGDNNISNKLINLFRHAIVSIEHALNMVVIKTLSGSAKTAGYLVDKISTADVLGSVAGDDTLLVITKTEDAALWVVKTLNSILEN